MHETNYKRFFDKIYRHAYTRDKRGAESITISASFKVQGEDKEMANDDKAGIIHELRSIAEYHQPEKIMVVVNTDGEKKVYHESFSQSANNENMISQELSSVQQLPVNSKEQFQQPFNGFAGLGQVGVEEYINKKLEDERKDRKLQELEQELQKKTEEVSTLSETIRQLETGIEDHEKEKDNLEGILESKNNIRYWAGLTGDILESFGLSKDKLREPLAGLIASENEDEPKQISQGQSMQDESGIVEDSTTRTKRDEIISLINDYLKTVDNPTLANVFMIFSEIEKDNNKATSILEQLNQQTQE